MISVDEDDLAYLLMLTTIKQHNYPYVTSNLNPAHLDCLLTHDFLDILV